MASLAPRTRGNSKTWEIRFRSADGRQKTLGLGAISKRNADAILRHVRDLIEFKRVGERPRGSAAEWLKELDADGKLHKSLVRHGLASAGSARLADPAQRAFKAYLDDFVARMICHERTRINYAQTAGWLLAYFPDNVDLEKITAADIERWSKHLKQEGLAYSTRRKHIQRCKKFFSHAVDSRLLDTSPAANLPLEPKPKLQRKSHFISRVTATKVLDGLGDARWRLIFALLRYQGMRRCELVSLKWEHVRWDSSLLEIHSPKTGFRECPIFPETRPYLEAMREEAGFALKWNGTDDTLTPLLRKRLVRILGAEHMWPKTCVMLRSTRRTELDEQFPTHVVNDWIGHSTEIANRHYQQVTAEHWLLAVSPHNETHNTPSLIGAFTATLGMSAHEKTLENQGLVGATHAPKYPRKDSNLGPAD